MDLEAFPALNAALNAACFLFLVLGWAFIRQRAVTAHTMAMLAACATSCLFLASYLYYHAHHGATRFPGTGFVRAAYFAILVSHTALAVVIVPLVARTLARALRGRFEAHARLARVTLPLWLYVSVTGVVVYWILCRSPWGVGP
jgi:putative membrane protein